MTRMFQAGDKVRCIRSDLDRRDRGVPGTVYTVKVGGPFLGVEELSGTALGAHRFELVEAPRAFKPGDRVRIVRKVDGETPGFKNCWVSSMDEAVGTGRILTVQSVDSHGVYFETTDRLSGEGCGFPPAALELVKAAVATGDAPIDLKSLKVGDKVTLSVTVEVTATCDCDGDVSVSTVGDAWPRITYLYGARAHFGTVEVAARQPPVVGEDAVITKRGDRVHVIAIDGDFAWVRRPGSNLRMNRPVSALHRA